MTKLFDIGRRKEEPFLAPLGGQRGIGSRLRRIRGALPEAAAPVAVTLVGGLALVVVLAMILGREPAGRAEAPSSGGEFAALEDAAAEDEPVMITTEDARLDQAFRSVSRAAEPLPPQEPALPVEEFPDPEQTASILSAVPTERALRPGVEVAETEEEIAALEAIQRREVEDDVGLPQPQPAALAAPATTMRDATTNNYVNMRAGPADDAEILLVVPIDTDIRAEDDCDWCEVAYDGRAGYIYRTFINYR